MQKYSIIVILILFLGTSCSLKTVSTYLSQSDIVHQESAEKATNTNACNKTISYAPDSVNPDHTPKRYVRVVCQFINNSNGSLTFNDEKAATDFAEKMIAAANDRLRNNQKMWLPAGNNTPVLPINFEFVLDKTPENNYSGVFIKFEEDDDLAYFIKTGKRKNVFNTAIHTKYKYREGEVLNFYMMEHPPDSVGRPNYKASCDGIGLHNFLKFTGTYQNLYDTIHHDNGTHTLTIPSKVIGIMLHEVGHTLGLAHTWGTNDGCDDTPYNNNCWNFVDTKPCNTWGNISNNLMDYNAYQHAVSPCQIGKIQYNFAKLGSSQRQFLMPVWCTYKAEKTISIGLFQNIEWLSARDLEGDIIITNGAKLTIKCRVALPKGAKIIVKPNATLVLDGAEITNLCGDQWEGIVIESSKKNKGTVIFKNKPQLNNMKQKPEAEINTF